jgi:hypothetical protein
MALPRLFDALPKMSENGGFCCKTQLWNKSGWLFFSNIGFCSRLWPMPLREFVSLLVFLFSHQAQAVLRGGGGG